jgi:pyruvate/2-oxoglutarate dehydrogenase complex dihydrolipoamide acyltransferase (E2) component
MERYSLQEAAEILEISPDAIRKRIQRGELRSVKDADGSTYVLLESTQDDRAVQATDAARRKAEELGIDLSQLGTWVQRTGHEGVITAEDVQYAANVNRAVDPIPKTPTPVSEESEESERVLPRRAYPSSRRLNVVFSDSAYNTLKHLADDSGKTISDVVRDAIALQKWFNDTRSAGARILVEDRGRVREILQIR